MDTLSHNLLPCPFCGNKAEWQVGSDNTTWAGATCKLCGVTLDENRQGCMKLVAETWNRRADVMQLLTLGAQALHDQRRALDTPSTMHLPSDPRGGDGVKSETSPEPLRVHEPDAIAALLPAMKAAMAKTKQRIIEESDPSLARPVGIHSPSRAHAFTDPSCRYCAGSGVTSYTGVPPLLITDASCVCMGIERFLRDQQLTPIPVGFTAEQAIAEAQILKSDEDLQP